MASSAILNRKELFNFLPHPWILFIGMHRLDPRAHLEEKSFQCFGR